MEEGKDTRQEATEIIQMEGHRGSSKGCRRRGWTQEILRRQN